MESRIAIVTVHRITVDSTGTSNTRHTSRHLTQRCGARLTSQSTSSAQFLGWSFRKFPSVTRATALPKFALECRTSQARLGHIIHLICLMNGSLSAFSLTEEDWIDVK